MRTVRSSEISNYVFCQRAWWYQQNGYLQENLGALAGGNIEHERHGRYLVWTGRLRKVGLIFLLFGIGLSILYASSLIF